MIGFENYYSKMKNAYIKNSKIYADIIEICNLIKNLIEQSINKIYLIVEIEK